MDRSLSSTNLTNFNYLRHLPTGSPADRHFYVLCPLGILFLYMFIILYDKDSRRYRQLLVI